MVDWSSRGRIAEHITEAAGLTPLLRLRKVAVGPQALCGKLEFMNPSSSLKDRILRRMVSSAEERGDLTSAAWNVGAAARIDQQAPGWVQGKTLTAELSLCTRSSEAVSKPPLPKAPVR